jgi:hypothetical protein
MASATMTMTVMMAAVVMSKGVYAEYFDEAGSELFLKKILSNPSPSLPTDAPMPSTNPKTVQGCVL